MFRRAAMLVAVVALVTAGATVADAKRKPKVHAFTSHVDLVVLSSEGNPPASGSSVDLGRSSSPQLGKGAIVQHTTYGDPAVGSFKATGRAFGNAGSFRYKLSGSGTSDPQGNVTFTGKGKILGGSGRYRGARGSFTFTGTSKLGDQRSAFEVTGKIRY